MNDPEHPEQWITYEDMLAVREHIGSSPLTEFQQLVDALSSHNKPKQLGDSLKGFIPGILEEGGWDEYELESAIRNKVGLSIEQKLDRGFLENSVSYGEAVARPFNDYMDVIKRWGADLMGLAESEIFSENPNVPKANEYLAGIGVITWMAESHFKGIENRVLPYFDSAVDLEAERKRHYRAGMSQEEVTALTKQQIDEQRNTVTRLFGLMKGRLEEIKQDRDSLAEFTSYRRIAVELGFACNIFRHLEEYEEAGRIAADLQAHLAKGEPVYTPKYILETSHNQPGS